MFSWLKSSGDVSVAEKSDKTDAVGLAIETIKNSKEPKTKTIGSWKELDLIELFSIMTRDWADAGRIPELLNSKKWVLDTGPFDFGLLIQRLDLYETRRAGFYCYPNETAEVFEKAKSQSLLQVRSKFGHPETNAQKLEYKVCETIGRWHHPLLPGVDIYLHDSTSFGGSGRHPKLILLVHEDQKSIFELLVSDKRLSQMFISDGMQNYYQKQKNDRNKDILVTAYKDIRFRDYSSNLLLAHFAAIDDSNSDNPSNLQKLKTAAGLILLDSDSSTF